MHGASPALTPGPRRSLRRIRITGLALAFAALAVVSTAGPAFAWGGAEFSPADEQLLFSLTNQDRASAGLNALVNDTYLHTKAEWRAKDMGDQNYFSHQIPPDNQMVFSYMQQDGYCFKVAGENIGLSTYGDDIATTRLETAFMGSTSHRDNILGTWARMGVGAYKAADGRKLYAVLFSIPCGVTVPVPAPVTTPAPPAANPTPRPTPKPVVKATPAPTAVPTLTPTPTDSPTPEPTMTPEPTIAPSEPAATSPDPFPSAAPGSSSADTATSLRVREKAASAGPVDSLFHWLFGGVFGW
jgi:uncharacterized protein YkwD